MWNRPQDLEGPFRHHKNIIQVFEFIEKMVFNFSSNRSIQNERMAFFPQFPGIKNFETKSRFLGEETRFFGRILKCHAQNFVEIVFCISFRFILCNNLKTEKTFL